MFNDRDQDFLINKPIQISWKNEVEDSKKHNETGGEKAYGELNDNHKYSIYNEDSKKYHHGYISKLIPRIMFHMTPPFVL